MSGRDLILGSAFELFCEKGFDAVSIRDIGQRSGLTNPALYQHFNGKNALAEKLYLDCYEKLIQAIEFHLTNKSNALEKIEAYISGSLSLHQSQHSPLLYLEDHQRKFGILVREIYGDRAVSIRLKSWIEFGQIDGEIRSDISPDTIVAMCIGQVTKAAIMMSMELLDQKCVVDELILLTRSALSPSLKGS